MWFHHSKKFRINCLDLKLNKHQKYKEIDLTYQIFKKMLTEKKVVVDK